MRRGWAIWVVGGLVALGLAPSAWGALSAERVATPARGGGEFAAGEAIVRYERGATARTRRSARRAAGVEFDQVVGLPRAELVAVEGSVGAAVRRLERQPGVELAQPNYRYEALAPAPDDSFFGELWGLTGTHGVGALAAWDRSIGAGVTIAVLDTGVDLTHPDLEPNLWSNPGQGSSGDGDGNDFVGDQRGYDFVDDDADPDDFHFHGTHVAGTAAAVAGNARGVAGVAPGSRIMAVRVLDGNGEGSSATIAAGIEYAAEEGARVLNLSLGGSANPEEDQAVSAAIDLAQARGAIVVAAAGNEGSDNDAAPTTPCNMPQANVICVAAINQLGGLAKFSSTAGSNYGAKSVDIGAPGTSILSAKPDYRFAPGTTGIEDFQAGDGGWSGTQVKNSGVEWERIEDPKAEGEFVLTDSPGGDYALAPSANLEAFSEVSRGPIDLGGERGCRMHFDARYEIQDPGSSAHPPDALAAGARSGASIEYGDEFAGTTPEFANVQRRMVRREVSFSELDGASAARPGFAIFSDDIESYDGAYIDNVLLLCRDQSYTPQAVEVGERWDLPSSGSYFRLQGTSMAAPHVAGVAALVLGAVPGLTAAEAVAAIRAGARPLASLAGRTVSGGAVDASAAIEAALRPPTVTIDAAPPALGKVRRPTILFSANRPASFACSLDGGAFAPCSSPFVPATPLTEGSHGFVVRATDVAGRSGQSAVVGFRIDARRPRVILRQRPPKTVRTRARRALAVFRLGSNEPGVRFICRVDGGLPRFCGQRFARRYTVGRHVVRVRAADPAGNVTRRATVYRFRVKRIR